MLQFLCRSNLEYFPASLWDAALKFYKHLAVFQNALLYLLRVSLKPSTFVQVNCKVYLDVIMLELPLEQLLQSGIGNIVQTMSTNLKLSRLKLPDHLKAL